MFVVETGEGRTPRLTGFWLITILVKILVGVTGVEPADYGQSLVCLASEDIGARPSTMAQPIRNLYSTTTQLLRNLYATYTQLILNYYATYVGC